MDAPSAAAVASSSSSSRSEAKETAAPSVDQVELQIDPTNAKRTTDDPALWPRSRIGFVSIKVLFDAHVHVSQDLDTLEVSAPDWRDIVMIHSHGHKIGKLITTRPTFSDKMNAEHVMVTIWDKYTHTSMISDCLKHVAFSSATMIATVHFLYRFPNLKTMGFMPVEVMAVPFLKLRTRRLDMVALYVATDKKLTKDCVSEAEFTVFCHDDGLPELDDDLKGYVEMVAEPGLSAVRLNKDTRELIKIDKPTLTHLTSEFLKYFHGPWRHCNRYLHDTIIEYKDSN